MPHHPTHTSRLTRLAAATVAGATLLLTACGGQSEGTSSPTVPSLAPDAGGDTPGAGTAEAPTDMNEATALYMACMSDAGFSMRVGEEVDAESDAFTAADQECQKHMVNADDPLELDPEAVAEQKDFAIEYGKCMQAAGFDVEVGADGGIMGSVEDASKDGYAEASATCSGDQGDASGQGDANGQPIPLGGDESGQP